MRRSADYGIVLFVAVLAMCFGLHQKSNAIPVDPDPALCEPICKNILDIYTGTLFGEYDNIVCTDCMEGGGCALDGNWAFGGSCTPIGSTNIYFYQNGTPRCENSMTPGNIEARDLNTKVSNLATPCPLKFCSGGD
jgi:hypothetical protein